MGIRKIESSYMPVVNAEPAEAIHTSVTVPGGSFVSSFYESNVKATHTVYQVPEDTSFYFTFVQLSFSTPNGLGGSAILITDSSDVEIHRLIPLNLISNTSRRYNSSIVPPFILAEQQKIRFIVNKWFPWVRCTVAGYEY